MSAFVVSPQHIATCAAIVFEYVLDYEKEPPNIADVRMELAVVNVLSVTWRYGPHGAVGFDPILRSAAGILDDTRFDPNSSHARQGISSVNEICFDNDCTVSEYFDDCRAAEVVPYSTAEASMYLSCLNYQSCETPGWKADKVYGWIQQANGSLAYRLASAALGNRRVWEVRESDRQFV